MDLYLIKEGVVSSPDSSPVGLAIQVHLNHWFDVVARQLAALYDAYTNLDVRRAPSYQLITATTQTWTLTVTILQLRSFTLRARMLMVGIFLYLISGETCCSRREWDLICQESRNYTKDNTWKSWGLLAKPLCLLRLSRRGFRSSFPAWLAVAEDTPPPWPPPSSRASPSSTSLLPSERQERLFPYNMFVLPSNISLTYQHPHTTYLHQAGHLRGRWRHLEAVHTQSASLWLPGKIQVRLNHWLTTICISVGMKRITHPDSFLFLIHQGHILGWERPRLTTGQVSQKDLCWANKPERVTYIFLSLKMSFMVNIR